MEGVLAVLLLAAVAGGHAWHYFVARPARVRTWRQAAEHAGLVDIDASGERMFEGMGLTGRSDNLKVRIERDSNQNQKQTKITIADPARPIALTLRREDIWSGVDKGLGGREIAIGDPAFDEHFYLGGAPAQVRALLDVQTRIRLGDLDVRANIAIADGELRGQIKETSFAPGLNAVLPRILSEMLIVARRLTDTQGTAERLSHNTCHDPQPTVRLENLLCLLREFREYPGLSDTLRRACQDRTLEIRIKAAQALGDEGVRVLMEVAEDPTLEDVWAAAAIAALGVRLPVDRAKNLFQSAARSWRFESARATVEAIGARGGNEGVDTLMTALAHPDSRLSVPAARALGRRRITAAETALIDALGGDVPGLPAAAAEALGQMGTVTAVLPLRQAAEESRDRDFRRAARQAIAEIQSRIAGASPGQLSIAESEAGQLSLADTKEGGLSFPGAADAGKSSSEG